MFRHIILYYGVPLITVLLNILLIILIWKKSKQEDEDNIVWKTIGYTFLASFRFTINSVMLPVGALLAILMAYRAKQNVIYKKNIVLMCLLFFIISLLPIHASLDKLLFPRDQISTFLLNVDENEFDYNMIWTNRMEQYQYHTEHMLYNESETYELYRELTLSKAGSLLVTNQRQWELYLSRHNLPKHLERFEGAQFYVSEDYKLLTIVHQNQQCYFLTTEVFQQLFAAEVAGKQKGSS